LPIEADEDEVLVGLEPELLQAATPMVRMAATARLFMAM
jgi:hypothetical protein